MNDHLHECDVAIWERDRLNDPLAPRWMGVPDDIPCQCEKLRSCEQRVRGDMADPLDHLITFAEGAQTTAYAAGRTDALRQAREAVKRKRDYWYTRAVVADPDTLMGHLYNAYVASHEADLAAIDAVGQQA
jgi:hypothetical protein